jgi:hypothetical protein
MLEDELYIESVLRSRSDEAQSMRARMRREALLLRAAEREARQRAERAEAARRARRARRPIGGMFPD